MKIFWITNFVWQMKGSSIYPKITIDIQVYSHIKSHEDLIFILKYTLAHMCPTCIMHRSR